jgi:FAD/FMN-containing dehydrogenase
VKGGGHASNLGFSSTRGVQISLTRFNDITVDSTAGTVELGPGLTWDQVYATLDPIGVNVVGARLPGVGVAGVMLGGGERLSSDTSTGYASMIT